MDKREREYVLYDELVDAAEAIKPYYDIDKIKTYSVYVWTKGNGDPNSDGYWGDNVFDIHEDKIVFYVKDHVIPEKVMPIIKNIQSKIKAIRLNREELKENNNETT